MQLSQVFVEDGLAAERLLSRKRGKKACLACSFGRAVLRAWKGPALHVGPPWSGLGTREPCCSDLLEAPLTPCHDPAPLKQDIVDAAAVAK